MTASTTVTAITLDKSETTTKNVLSDIRSSLRSDGRYAAFVAAHPVTAENVKDVTAENVKDYAYSLAGMVTPAGPVTKDGSRTRFGNAVQTAQKGLTRALDSEDGDDSEPTVNLLTAAGKKATREDVLAAWEAAQES